MAARIAKLQQMSTAQLRAQWRQVMGEEPRSHNRQWMFKRLAWAIQALEYGGLSERAKQRLEELLPFAEVWMPLGRKAFPRGPSTNGKALTTGTIIVRDYKGRSIAVTVLEDGFEFDGKRYPSLTAIAKAVSGSHWSGPHFFGLKGNGRAR